MNRVYEIDYTINDHLKTILGLGYKIAGPGLITVDKDYSSNVFILSPVNVKETSLYSLCVSELNGVLLLDNLYYYKYQNKAHYLIIEKSFSSVSTLLGSYGCCLDIDCKFYALFESTDDAPMNLFKELPLPLNVKFLYIYLCLDSNVFEFTHGNYQQAFMEARNLNGSASFDVPTILNSLIPNKDKLIQLYNLCK